MATDRSTSNEFLDIHKIVAEIKANDAAMCALCIQHGRSLERLDGEIRFHERTVLAERAEAEAKRKADSRAKTEEGK